ncbi:MAG: MarR family transcriptional regulator [Ornithinimicrobium sp.]
MTTSSAADALATELMYTIKVLRASAHTFPRLHEAVDPLSHPLLFALVPGPMRVSDLASTVNNDLSTVSRQVSSLQDYGLITKVSDPQDGRAQLLSLSEQGRTLVEAARVARAEVFDDLLRDWDSKDVDRFTHYLHVFAAGVHARHLAHNERATQ